MRAERPAAHVCGAIARARVDPEDVKVRGLKGDHHGLRLADQRDAGDAVDRALQLLGGFQDPCPRTHI